MVAVHEITKVSLDDEGTYKCLGKNDAGVAEEILYLTVDDNSIPSRGDITGKMFFCFLE